LKSHPFLESKQRSVFCASFFSIYFGLQNERVSSLMKDHFNEFAERVDEMNFDQRIALNRQQQRQDSGRPCLKG